MKIVHSITKDDKTWKKLLYNHSLSNLPKQNKVKFMNKNAPRLIWKIRVQLGPNQFFISVLIFTYRIFWTVSVETAFFYGFEIDENIQRRKESI